MPVTSDASPFTSVTVSPMDPQDTDELPIELKVPLPLSGACSDEEGETEGETKRAFEEPASTVFDSSARPGSNEDLHRTEIWSTTCARNFTEAFTGARSGSEEFAIAALDGFANFQDWSLKPKMESYLIRILAEGSFLLDQPLQPPAHSKEPIEMHHASAAIREAEFFEKALTDLFELLTTQLNQQPQQAVPESVLTFVHATLRKIEDSDHKLRATRNGHALVNPAVRDGIMAVFQIFEPPDVASEPLSAQTVKIDDEESTRFLMLSTHDIIGLIQTLFPERTPKLETHEHGSAVAFSDRPSTAGSSTLIAGSSDVGSAEAPSTAPSSIDTSDKLTSDGSFAVATHIAEQDFAYASKGELKDVTTNITEVAQQDLGPQLRSICSKFKAILPHQQGSNRGNAWTLIYYSQDGSTLSIGNGSSIISDVFQNPALNNSSRKDDPARDNKVLEAAVIKLLNESNKYLSMLPNSARTGHNADHSDPLERLMERTASQAQSSLDFRAAYSWWQALKTYHGFLNSDPNNSLQTLLFEVAESLKRATEAATRTSSAYDIKCRSLVCLQQFQSSTLSEMEERRKALRIKTWYMSDVRHSAIYEEALLVTRALRAMTSSKRTKQGSGLSSWARQRLRGYNVDDRSEAQALEALTAPKEYGGLAKLADEQAEFTSRWLTRKSIENFCKGEERIHRFCYEIQRSVGKIAGLSLLESPVLWSSNLFRSERTYFASQPRTGISFPPNVSTTAPPSPLGYGSLQTTTLASPGAPAKGLGLSKTKTPTSTYGGFWPVGHAPRAPPAVAYHPILPPTPTSPPTGWSSNVVAPGSPFTPPPSSVSGFGRHSSHSSNEEGPSPEKRVFAEQIKKNLCGLLLSDLGYLLWNQGSETDAWINEHIADEKSIGAQDDKTHYKDISERNFYIAHASGGPRGTAPLRDGETKIPDDSGLRPDPVQIQPNTTDAFPFLEGYASVLASFSLAQDPYVKLEALYKFEGLILSAVYQTSMTESAKDTMRSDPNKQWACPTDFSLRSKNVPRTKATSLEEIIANCTERRAGTLKFDSLKRSTIVPSFVPEASPENIPGTDDIVNEMLSIFRSTNLRPTTLFRDLQYIAAFVPSEILDQTAQGKAFWDVALAALALKDDLCDLLITRANDITAYHIPSPRLPNSSVDNVLASTTLRDAANLWLIAAKEGSPIAARELGLFYLTHPELLPRTTMPFSKAKDVFRSVIALDHRNGDKERGALDPYTFVVVRHWMENAANGGDKDAKDFLRGSGDVDVGR
ncbi:hypothetical protein P7C71_g5750, partial [Lecanoromycetidae sp. Uapishka_2]